MKKVVEKEAVKKAVVVARVSSAGQTDNTSFAVQFEAAQKKAAMMGLEIIRYYEETVTGAGYLDRTETQKALRDLETGLAKNIIFYDFSRFSRDEEYQQVMKKRISTAGGKLILCSGEFSDNAEGDLQFSVQGSFAAYERKKINERCSNGRQKKLEQGIQVYRTNPAFGYHIVQKIDVAMGTYPTSQIGKYVINEEQAVWVRKIYELYAAGNTVSYIVRYLHDNGVRTGRGGIFDRSNICELIRRTAYKGMVATNKRKRLRDESRLAKGLSVYYTVDVPESEWTFIDCPRIVSDDLWNAANERLNKGRFNSVRPEKRHVFAGLFFCSCCGRRLSGRYRSRRNKKDVVYFCSYSQQKKLPHLCCSEKRAFAADKLEPLVIEALTLMATRREIIERVYEEYASDSAQNEAGLEHFEQQLKQLEKKEVVAATKQIEAEMEGRPSSVYDNLLREIALQKTAIENQVQELHAIVQSKTMHKEKAELISEIVDDVVTTLNDKEVLTNAEKNKLLSFVIERIEVIESLDRGIIMKLRHDGHETLVVRHLDGEVEAAIGQPEFEDDGQLRDFSSYAKFDLHNFPNISGDKPLKLENCAVDTHYRAGLVIHLN